MSAFILKLIAVVSMLTDHAGYILYLAGKTGGSTYILLRSIGRPAFVIFAFLIVNGLEKTSDVRHYLSRLMLFAILSQPAYSLAFSSGNYTPEGFLSPSGLYGLNAAVITVLVLITLSYLLLACRRKPDISLLWLIMALVLPFVRLNIGGLTVLGGDLSIFYTLAISLALLACLQLLCRSAAEKSGRVRALLLFFTAVAAAAIFQSRSDYGFMGLLLIIMLWLTRRSRPLQAAAAVLWCVSEYLVRLGSIQFTLFAAAAVIPMLCYNGQRGRSFKLGFYLIYPVHLYIFSLIGIFVSR